MMPRRLRTSWGPVISWAMRQPPTANTATRTRRTISTTMPLGGVRRPLTALRCASRGGATSTLAGRLNLAVGVVEDLVDHGTGLLLGRAHREHQLGDEDLPGLREHPLLARGEALLSLPDGEVPNDLGHLVDVARTDLLDVRLVPAAPVRGHPGLLLPEHLHDLLDVSLADDLPEPDFLGVVHGDHQLEV